MEVLHVPVLLKESISSLDIREGGTYLDCTLGAGGHSGEILKKLQTGRLISLDKDDDAINYCKQKFENESKITIVKSDFKKVCEILDDLGIEKVDGVLMDLGVSSYQIDSAQRGFSYMAEGPLDMRMDASQSLTAKEVVNNYSEEKLAYIIKEYGDEVFASLIARNICRQRELGQIKTTTELVSVIDRSMPYSYKRRIGHCAKKTFQAIRIEVNGELEGLKDVTEKLIERLNKGGRISVITFHSLEDKIIKDVFKEYALNCICPKDFPICICGHRAQVKIINKKPLEAGIEELQLNPRSSSAKLRTAEKII